MKNKTISVITVIQSSKYKENSSVARRTWGYFFDFATAEKVVLENQTDIFEFIYDLAVIEEYQQGWFQTPKETWYKARFIKSPKKGRSLAEEFRETKVKVAKIARPRMFAGTCNFAMG